MISCAGHNPELVQELEGQNSDEGDAEPLLISATDDRMWRFYLNLRSFAHRPSGYVAQDRFQNATVARDEGGIQLNGPWHQTNKGRLEKRATRAVGLQSTTKIDQVGEGRQGFQEVTPSENRVTIEQFSAHTVNAVRAGEWLN